LEWRSLGGHTRLTDGDFLLSSHWNAWSPLHEVSSAEVCLRSRIRVEQAGWNQVAAA
jgi:hypothetical protein